LSCDGGVDDIFISSTFLSSPISTCDLLATIGIWLIMFSMSVEAS
jgi:hypothetical protein